MIGYSKVRAVLLGVVLSMISSVSVAMAASIADERWCNVDKMPRALRQTTIVVDGRLISPETDKVLPENQGWRKFVMRFLDVADPSLRQRVDARERVSVVVANADGSGLTTLFTGCIPLQRAEEERDLDATTTKTEIFFGSDWRSSQKKAGEKFTATALYGLVQGVKGLPSGPGETVALRDGTLVADLAKIGTFPPEYGVPRIVILTDLGFYALPDADVPKMRAVGRADAEATGINFQRAEVHLFGMIGRAPKQARHYLEAFFLAGRGHLATLTAQNGTMNVSAPPRALDVYQGTIDFPDAKHPLRLRLATDQNRTVVDSWVEVQSSQPQFVPFFGIMSCESDRKCRYQGNNVFAQIWDDEPGPVPNLKAWQPFGGMRILDFELTGDRLSGRVHDVTGYIVGRENGLEFQVTKVPNGMF